MKNNKRTVRKREEPHRFYDDVYRVCEEKGKKPTIVLRELGMSTGNVAQWKRGGSPTITVAKKIAAHLGVSLSYLCSPEEQED